MTLTQLLKRIERGLPDEIAVLHGCAKLNKARVKLIVGHVHALVNDHSRLVVLFLDLVNLAFDRHHSDLLMSLDVVPDAQIVSVLCHDHVRVGYPLNERAKV